MKRGKTPLRTALLLVFVGAALALVFGKSYSIRDDGGGEVLWNSKEAYLFMVVRHRGFQITYLEYPWVVVKELLYGVRGPDNQRTSVTVVHITQSGLERHVVQAHDEEQANTPDLYKVIEDHVYANYHGHAYKWTSDRFEKATEEEQRRYEETKPIVVGEVEEDPGGWSDRGFGIGVSNYKFGVDAGEFTLQVTNEVTRVGGHGILSVQLARPGQRLEEILHLDGHPRRVNKGEFERAFK